MKAVHVAMRKSIFANVESAMDAARTAMKSPHAVLYVKEEGWTSVIAAFASGAAMDVIHVLVKYAPIAQSGAGRCVIEAFVGVAVGDAIRVLANFALLVKYGVIRFVIEDSVKTAAGDVKHAANDQGQCLGNLFCLSWPGHNICCE